MSSSVTLEWQFTPVRHKAMIVKIVIYCTSQNQKKKKVDSDKGKVLDCHCYGGKKQNNIHYTTLKFLFFSFSYGSRNSFFQKFAFSMHFIPNDRGTNLYSCVMITCRVHPDPWISGFSMPSPPTRLETQSSITLTSILSPLSAPTCNLSNN